MISSHLCSCFWWPHIIEDIKWYTKTYHECQVQQMRKLHIPPTILIPGRLFQKAHIDTRKMPKAGRFEYLIQAHCTYIVPRMVMLCKENTRMLCAFIFEELLCRWGPITEIITDNVPTYKVTVDELTHKYGIHPIHVSPYNSQANGIVKRWHHDIREAIIKTCEGDKTCWNQVVHSVFWAECVTIQKVMGLSPYFMMHGVEPIFSFNLAEAMFLAPLKHQGMLTTTELIAWNVCQLQKCTEDLEAIGERVVAACLTSIHKFERCFCANIKLHDFQPGAYVLVCNSKVKYELSKKTKLRYLRPMVVVCHTKGGSYMLAELDSAISKLRFATFRVIPYYTCCDKHVSVTKMTGIDDESIDEMEASETIEPEEDNPEGALYG
jgi:hypothetical protein